jgi:hypothetical protein
MNTEHVQNITVKPQLAMIKANWKMPKTAQAKQ